MRRHLSCGGMCSIVAWLDVLLKIKAEQILTIFQLCAHQCLVWWVLDLWWHHCFGALFALLALCEGNPPITGGVPSQRANDMCRCYLFVRLSNPDSKVRGAHLGPVGPRWAPCWHHEPCYQGSCWKCLFELPVIWDTTKFMWRHHHVLLQVAAAQDGVFTLVSTSAISTWEPPCHSNKPRSYAG